MDSDGRNGESNLWVDEFFKFEICSIKIKKKKKKLDPFVSNVKDHGILRLNPFFLCVFKRVS